MLLSWPKLPKSKNTTHDPNTFHPTKKPVRVNPNVATWSQTLEERIEEALKIHAEESAQFDYLRRQSGERWPKRPRWPTQYYMDFKVEIPKFAGQLNPDAFLVG